MKRLLALAVLSLSFPVAAEEDAPRPSGEDRVTTRSLIELQTCITRYWARSGRITPIPIEGGVALDWAMGNGWPMSSKANITYEIRDAGDLRHVTVAYRHPNSKAVALNYLKATEKNCFPAELTP